MQTLIYIRSEKKKKQSKKKKEYENMTAALQIKREEPGKEFLTPAV